MQRQLLSPASSFILLHSAGESVNEEETCHGFACTSLTRASPFPSPCCLNFQRFGRDRREGGGRKLSDSYLAWFFEAKQMVKPYFPLRDAFVQLLEVYCWSCTFLVALTWMDTSLLQVIYGLLPDILEISNSPLYFCCWGPDS